MTPLPTSRPRRIVVAAVMMARKIEADAAPIGVRRRIAVPSAGPGFETVALFSFIAAWTDLLIPITMPTRPDGMDVDR